MTQPELVDRRARGAGRRVGDIEGPTRDASATASRRSADKSRSTAVRRALVVASQTLLASVMLIAGAIWTEHQEKPVFANPGKLLKLPGITVQANQAAADTASAARIFKVSQVLRKYTKDTTRANRIAEAVVTEGKKKNIDPAMLVGVLLTEDAKLDPNARSNVGAQGLMQVMPFHKGKWGCGNGSLTDIESNICYGSAILAQYIEKAPDIKTALQHYNGCVRGTNTPNCSSYSGKVLRYADQVAQQMLGMMLPDFLKAQGE